MINGFLAPRLLVIIMLIANNIKVMETRVNGLTMNLLGWTAAILMTATAVGLGLDLE